MKAKDLRNSILQLAVEGKLVPQDPSDEPASVLLERIREERAKLIKEKKIKAPKGGESIIYRGLDGSFYEKRGIDNPVCIDEEIPFEIPDSWEWARLQSICKSIRAGGDKPRAFSNEMMGKYAVPVIANGETNGGIVGFTTEPTVSEKAITVSGRGTIGFSMVRNTPFTPIVRLLVLLLVENTVQFEYLQNVFSCLLETGVGSAVQQLTVPMISPKLIPVPPVQEQKRIVNKLSELLPLVDEYGSLEDSREQLDAELPEKLRKSILQEAVQGKLVEQDPGDEPASALLDRIRAEREKLIKEKKIKAPKGGESIIYRGPDGSFYEKKGKEEPVCIDEELPFEIPESWEWARLNSICTHIVDGDHNPPPNSGKGIPILSAANVHDGRLHIEEASRWITESDYVKAAKRLSVSPGNVLMTIVGTIGRTAVLDTSEPFALQRSVSVIAQMSIIPEYLAFVLESYAGYLQSISSGTAQKGVYLGTVGNLLIPIAPAEEQKRIVRAFLKLLSIIG